MDKPESKTPAMTDVLQSDHHVHMSDEEIAKARAHHNKRHSDTPQNAAKNEKGKKGPVKPR